MRNLDKRRYEMLVRVRNFGAADGQHFPGTSTAHDALAVIAAEIGQLEALDVVERSASQAGRTTRTTAARKALIDCLRRADHTARVVARTHPELVADGRVSDPIDDVLLLTIAREFAKKATPLAEEFAAHGIQISELEDRLERFDSALHDRAMQRDERVRARARMDASFQRALDAVKTLDVIVANHLVNDAAALAVWRSSRRLGGPRRTRNSKVEVESSAPASAETAAPAVAAAGPQVS